MRRLASAMLLASVMSVGLVGCSGGSGSGGSSAQTALAGQPARSPDAYCASVKEGLDVLKSDLSYDEKNKRMSSVFNTAQATAPEDVQQAYWVVFEVKPGDKAAATKRIDEYNLATCQVNSAELRGTLVLPKSPGQ